jgi:serine protease Do
MPTVKKCGKWVWWGLILGFSLGNAVADNLPRTIEKIKPSVVGIGTIQPTRRPPSSFRGTGFAVGDGLHVVTNAHVVPAVLDTAKNEVLGVFVGQGEAAQFRPAQIVATDPEHDLALLKIGGLPLHPMTLGDSGKVREGEPYAFTGFPIGPVLGLYPVTHRATISSLTPIVIPTASAQQLDVEMLKRLRKPFGVFQLDGTAYPGNSGSPLFNPDTGAVVAIVNMVFVKGTKEKALTEPSGISYAIPADYLRALLTKSGLP